MGRRMTLTLFDLEDQGDDDCRYPFLDGSSGYRYGCRCIRCRTAKAQGRELPPTCDHAGCDQLRLKWHRQCSEHLAPTQVRKVRSDAPCQLCGRNHGWYESTLTANYREEIQDLYRTTCGGCRGPYVGAIKAHRLDTATAMRLITNERCELCDKPFSIGPNGRKHAVVDHNHGHCDGTKSCGYCVRGIICQRCNHVIASVEEVVDLGLDMVLDYLRRFGGDDHIAGNQA